MTRHSLAHRHHSRVAFALGVALALATSATALADDGQPVDIAKIAIWAQSSPPDWAPACSSL